MEAYVLADRKRQVWLIGIICAVSFMITLDYGGLNISLASIAKYFNIKAGLVAWLPTTYLLVITSSLLGFAKLGDIKGYRKVFILGLSVFCIGAFLCAISPNIYVLMAARGFQSLGQAMYSPACIAIITTFLPVDKKGKALGLYATFQGLGLALAPPLGGFITSNFSWRGNFLLAIPITAAVIFFSLKFIPSKQAKAFDTRFDIGGAVLLFFALASLLYAVNSGTKTGWADPFIISCFVISLISLTLFFLLEKKIAYPLLDFELFKNRNFTFAALASFTGLALYIGNGFLFPFYLQMLRHLDVSKSGLILMVSSVMMMTLAPFAGSAADRFGSRKLCVSAMAIVTVAFILFSFLSQDSSLAYVVLCLVCLGGGMGLFMAPNSKLLMAQAPLDKQGIASGVYKIALNAGSSIGIAMYLLVLAQVVLFDVAKMNIILSEAKNHPDIIMAGFRGAFIFGAILGVLTLVFSFLAKDKKEK